MHFSIFLAKIGRRFGARGGMEDQVAGVMIFDEKIEKFRFFEFFI